MHTKQLKASRSLRLGRHLLLTAALALSAAGAAQAQAYVNVTVGGAFAPGVFGQISIGNNPPPPVVNVQPIIAGPAVYGAPVMYLNVPPEESRDWPRYCNRYRACGHPVHFVRVEDNNRWWEHHNEHLRGEANYVRPDVRRLEEDERIKQRQMAEERRRAQAEESRH